MSTALMVALVAACSGLAALGGTAAVLAATRRFQWMDRPNVRSAHSTPMPTAGGLGIVAGFWAGLVAHGIAGGHAMPGSVLAGLLAGTAILLAMAWDDLVGPLHVPQKLALTAGAAGAWLAIHGVSPLLLPWGTCVQCGWVLATVGFFWFAAICNATNFMDGIDGIVGTHVVIVAAASGLLLWNLNGPWELMVTLAGAAGGFLLLNWPPARIFMGDVGSHFLGFVLGAGGLVAAGHGLPLWLFAVLNGAFLFDTGYTLGRRALRGENVLQAHRKHLYQRLARIGWSHRQVDTWVALVDVVLATGCCLYILASECLGGVVLGTGMLLLIGEAVYVEHRDQSFA